MRISVDAGTRVFRWRWILALAGGGAVALVFSLLVSMPSSEYRGDTEAHVILHSEIALVDGKLRVEKDVARVLPRGEPPVASILLAGKDGGFAGFSFFEFDIGGVRDGDSVLFAWRLPEADGEWRRARVPILAGKGLLRLDALPSWSADVRHAVLIVRTRERNWLEMGDLSFSTYSLAKHLRSLCTDWLDFEGWRTSSINRVSGGARDQKFAFAEFAIVWLLFSGLLLYFILRSARRDKSFRFNYLIPLGLIVWFVVDMRWQQDVFRQNATTLTQKHRARDDTLKWHHAKYPFLRELREAKKHLPEDSRRVFLAIPGLREENAHYVRARTPYELLPHSVYSWATPSLLRAHVREGDFVLAYVAADRDAIVKGFPDLLSSNACPERWLARHTGKLLVLAEIQACPGASAH